MTAPALWRRVLNTLAPGSVTLVDDSGSVQRAQIAIGGRRELHDDMPMLYAYGFSSNPPPGTDVLTVFLGGDRSSGVVAGTNNQPARFRGLATGEVVIHDDQGQSVRITRAGISITTSMPVTITAPLVHMTGDLHVDGDVLDHATTQPETMAGTRAVYNEHTHVDSRAGLTTPPTPLMP